MLANRRLRMLPLDDLIKNAIPDFPELVPCRLNCLLFVGDLRVQLLAAAQGSFELVVDAARWLLAGKGRIVMGVHGTLLSLYDLDFGLMKGYAFPQIPLCASPQHGIVAPRLLDPGKRQLDARDGAAEGLDYLPCGPSPGLNVVVGLAHGVQLAFLLVLFGKVGRRALEELMVKFVEVGLGLAVANNVS